MTDFRVWALYWVAAILQFFMAGGILWLARHHRLKTLMEEFDPLGDRDGGFDDLRG